MMELFNLYGEEPFTPSWIDTIVKYKIMLLDIAAMSDCQKCF